MLLNYFKGNDTSVTAVKAAEEEEDMGEDELANLVEELKINEVNMEDFEGEEDQEEDGTFSLISHLALP